MKVVPPLSPPAQGPAARTLRNMTRDDTREYAPENPNTGWKGRSLWATYGTSATWHIEGGKGTKPKLVNFRMRPDPLAK